MAALALDTSLSVKSARSAWVWMVVDMDSSSLVMREVSDERRVGRSDMSEDSVW